MGGQVRVNIWGGHVKLDKGVHKGKGSSKMMHRLGFVNSVNSVYIGEFCSVFTRF